MVMKVRDVLFIILAIVCIASFFSMYSHADTTTCTEDMDMNVEDVKKWGEYHLEKLCVIADCANERTETAEEIIEQYAKIYEYIGTEMFPHMQTTMNPTK